MTLQLADGRKTFLDFREKAPLAATRRHVPRRRRQRHPQASSRAATSRSRVPGTVAGLETARAKYGTMKRAELIAPAIRLAEQGFVLDQGDADMFAAARPTTSSVDPATRGDLPQPGPALRVAGDGWCRSDLAATLQADRARPAPPASTRGRWREAIVASSRAGKGIITQADLDRYTTRELAPVECDYRGYHIVSAPPPSSGGVVLCEMLNILEGYPLKDWGFRSAQAVHVPDRGDAPRLRRPQQLPRRSRLRRQPARRGCSTRPMRRSSAPRSTRRGGAVERAQARRARRTKAATPPTTRSSTRKGNAVAVTYTLNDWFGARVTAAGTGVLLNNEMDDFTAKLGVPNMYGLVQGEANAIAPGKRPLCSMSPTIVSRRTASR